MLSTNQVMSNIQYTNIQYFVVFFGEKLTKQPEALRNNETLPKNGPKVFCSATIHNIKLSRPSQLSGKLRVESAMYR